MTVETFMRESLAIEGIHRKPIAMEVEATSAFLALPRLSIADLVDLVAAYAPGKLLRDQVGRDVQVGSQPLPPGGPHIRTQLRFILTRINTHQMTPYEGHQAYESLHPFMDGNGRSGRAVWLWQMGGVGKTPLGFLHHFYYQALQAGR